MRRIALTNEQRRAIVSGQFIRVELGVWVMFEQGVGARSAFIGRKAGRLIAYANVCRHNPVELDLFEDRTAAVRLAPIAEDGVSLTCMSHGAIFRVSDGECTLGPCYGQALFRFDVDDDPTRGGIVFR
jgi:nitrite reductase/ring-hydroxylating ferredoxin subunit